MKTTSALHYLCTLGLCGVLGASPKLVLAQNGTANRVHAGGATFYRGHGVGGYYGGIGRYSYWHGGYYGWGGGYHRGWGKIYQSYPYYRWNYPYSGDSGRFSFPFGFTPHFYWLPYPSWYGYGAWIPSYYRHNYRPCGYRYPCQCLGDADRDCGRYRYTWPASNSVPPPARSNFALAQFTTVANETVSTPAATTSDNRRPTNPAVNGQPLRREVQNALCMLRGMPPSTRQRWIDSGRFDRFSPEERELLKQISDDRPLAITQCPGPFNGQR